MCSIKDNDRIIICRLESEDSWQVLSNPRYDMESIAMSSILFNDSNNYVEYKNCGVINRMIRYRDIGKYRIKKEEIKSEFVLRLEKLVELFNEK